MRVVREINDPGELAGLKPVWGELLARTPGASFFLSLRWLAAYWRHSGGKQRLRVLVVQDGRETVGILPLVVRREWTKTGRLGVLTYPLDSWGSFYGPIGGEPGAVLAAGLEYLRRIRRDWDYVELRWAGAPGTVPAETGRAMRQAGMAGIPSILDRTTILELHGSWEQHLARQPRRWRRNLRADERRLERLGRVEFIRYRPPGQAAGEYDPRWDLYNACEQVAAESWQGSSHSGTTLSHPSVRPFLRDMHEAAATEGAVDLNLLTLDGRPAAFVYNYHHRGCLYGLRMGYIAEPGYEGAGSVLLARVIRDSYARGDRLFDLGVGLHDWKRYFASRTLPILRFTYCPLLSMRAQLLRLKRWADSREVDEADLAGRKLSCFEEIDALSVG